MTGSHRFVVMGGDYMRADAGGDGTYAAGRRGIGAAPGETSAPFTL